MRLKNNPQCNQLVHFDDKMKTPLFIKPGQVWDVEAMKYSEAQMKKISKFHEHYPSHWELVEAPAPAKAK